MAFLQAAGRSTQTIKDDRLVAASVAKWEERPCEGFVSLWKTENYLDKLFLKNTILLYKKDFKTFEHCSTKTKAF